MSHQVQMFSTRHITHIWVASPFKRHDAGAVRNRTKARKMLIRQLLFWRRRGACQLFSEPDIQPADSWYLCWAQVRTSLSLSLLRLYQLQLSHKLFMQHADRIWSITAGALSCVDRSQSILMNVANCECLRGNFLCWCSFWEKKKKKRKKRKQINFEFFLSLFMWKACITQSDAGDLFFFQLCNYIIIVSFHGGNYCD